MKKLLLLVLSFVFLYSVQASAEQVVTVQIDSAASDFTLKDHTGKKHTLSEYQGSNVVLEWVNLDCPFVKKHYDSKNMQNLQKKYKEQGVVWLLICSSAKGKQGHLDAKTITKRLKDYDSAQRAYLLDPTGKVGKAYGAKTTPHMYIIDTKGTLVYAGAIDNKPSTSQDDIPGAQNYVVDALDALLSGESVAEKLTQPYGCSVKY